VNQALEGRSFDGGKVCAGKRLGGQFLARQVVADGQPERLTAEALRGRDVDGLERRLGVNALRIGGGAGHPLSAVTLGGGRDIAVEARRPGQDDLVAVVGFEYEVPDPSVDRFDHGVQTDDGHGRHCVAIDGACR
jgi:hypothetical protein